MSLGGRRRDAVVGWSRSNARVKEVRVVGPWANGTNAPDGRLNLALTLDDADGISGRLAFEEMAATWEGELADLVDLAVELQLYDRDGGSLGFRQAQNGAVMLYP